MTPLSEARVGDHVTIQKILGDDPVRNHLVELGFIPKSVITVVNKIGGSLVLQVKDSRIALGKEMASQILF